VAGSKLPVLFSPAVLFLFLFLSLAVLVVLLLVMVGGADIRHAHTQST
jgi:hypothetical protein